MKRFEVNRKMVLGVVVSGKRFCFWSGYNGRGRKELGKAISR